VWSSHVENTHDTSVVLFRSIIRGKKSWERALWLVAFLQKIICNLRQPMSLRHIRGKNSRQEVLRKSFNALVCHGWVESSVTCDHASVIITHLEARPRQHGMLSDELTKSNSNSMTCCRTEQRTWIDDFYNLMCSPRQWTVSDCTGRLTTVRDNRAHVSTLLVLFFCQSGTQH